MNFRFIFQTSDGQALTRTQFIEANILILTLLLVCFIWCVVSIFLYCYFRFFVSFGKTGGYTISEVNEDKEAGINFFLTLILPLLIGDLNEWQNLVVFVLIFIIIFILLLKTNLFYANPVLTLLGYHVYKLTFYDNSDINNECIVLTTSKISTSATIEYKKIADKVLFAKPIKL